MKRVILDTNIYGRMVEKREEERIRELIGKRPDIIIYGFDVVRKELRAASQQMRIDGKRLRLILLGIYDHLTERHMFDTTKLTKKLAEDYYAIYSRIGGIVSKNEIINDFLIVACASIHELDIVVSEDKETMLSTEALTAYDIVNRLKQYRLPAFINYETFGRLLT